MSALLESMLAGSRSDEKGQGTVEYVLVVLAAAAMASVLLAWVGKSSLIPTFFNSVIRFVTGSVG